MEAGSLVPKLPAARKTARRQQAAPRPHTPCTYRPGARSTRPASSRSPCTRRAFTLPSACRRSHCSHAGHHEPATGSNPCSSCCGSAGAFQLINSKDLVWSKLVHEYLMGARTPMTALRAWNADATRMPARMHSEYLRRLYLHNDLAEGRYNAFGQVVRLDDIRVPLFVLGTEKDHVSPWPSVYKVLRLARAPATFVLCSGGHNVGIVNPPEGPSAHPKASFRIARVAAGHAPADPQQLLHGLEPVAGSWWPAWEQWLRRHADGNVKGRKVPGLRDDHGRVERAPGRYVHGV